MRGKANLPGMGTRGADHVNDWVKSWVDTLAQPNPGTAGVPLCPFAKKSWDRGLVKVVQTEDLWQTVHEEVTNFFDRHDVVMCIQEDFDGEYEELEMQCDTLNNWFALSGKDIWLLSYQRDQTIVFIQALSKLDSASVLLEKLDYYTSYSPEDYDRLVHKRRLTRERCDHEKAL